MATWDQSLAAPGSSTGKGASPSRDLFQDEALEIVEALHDYCPAAMANTTTLTFKKGDLIRVYNKDPSGWHDGSVQHGQIGQRGWFPSNYTRPVPLESSSAMSKSFTDQPTINRTPLDSIAHAISILRRAGHEKRVAHYQPSTACVISAVRSVLSTTDCLTKESRILRANSDLAKQRKKILVDLASLVNQARKCAAINQSAIPGEDDQQDCETQKLMDLAQQVLDNVSTFFQIADSWGAAFKSPMSRTTDALISPDDRPMKLMDRQKELQKAKSLGDLRTRRKGSNDSQNSIPAMPLTPHSIFMRQSNDSFSSLLPPPLSAANSSTDSMPEPLTPSVMTFKSPASMLSTLNGLHDRLLSTIAAFIGHVHAHSRSSHSSSYAHLIDMACEAIETVHKIMTLVESISQNDGRKSASFTNDFEEVSNSKDALYRAVTELVSATQQATGALPEGAEPTETEDGEKQAMLHTATTVLRDAGSCVGSVKRYLHRREAADQVFEMVSQTHSPLISTPSSPVLETNPLRERHTLSMLGKTATSLSNLKEKYQQDERSFYERQKLPSLPSSAASSRSRNNSYNAEMDTERADSALSMRRGLPPPAPLNIRTNFPAKTPSPPQGAARMTKASTSSGHSVAESQSSLSSRRQSVSAASQMSKQASSISGSTHNDNPSARSYAPREISFNRDGQVTGGTLACLVERMTLHDTTIDPNFAKTFFLSFRLFTTPPELVDVLIARFNLQPPMDILEVADRLKLWHDKTLTPVRLRVFNIFKTWLESHWHPESDSIVLATLQVFTHESLAPIFQSAAARLSDLIAKRSFKQADLSRLRAMSRVASADRMRQGKPVIDGIPLHFPSERSPSPLAPSSVLPPTPAISKNLLNTLRTIPYSVIPITEFDPLELARQITIFESRVFCMIQPSELLSQEFSKKSTTVAVNIKAMTSLSTQITGWIAEIILQEQDAKKRTYLIKFFIKLAEKCYNLQNYNTLMAVLAALGSSTIARLRKTWDGLPSKYRVLLESLRKCTDHSRNYAEYRSLIRQASAPCLPFLGLYLTDVTFCYEGNLSTRPSPLDPSLSLINFDRYAKMTKIITDLQRFQSPYNLLEVPEIQVYLSQCVQSIKSGSEKDMQRLYRASLKLEPKSQADINPTEKRLDLSSWTNKTLKI